MSSRWDSSLYEQAHSFVWQKAADLIGWLAPQPGERILDLGCGTGQLTAKIAEAGAHVVGLDNSAEMLATARTNYPAIEFHLADAAAFHFDDPFDAVFSNAALHWVQDAEGVVRSVAATLKPGGRFVAEFGGEGNVRLLLAACLAALHDRGLPAENPWYFPSIAEYAALLERHGLEVVEARLFDRPVDLEGGDAGMERWLRMFGPPLLAQAPEPDRDALIRDIETRLRPDLFRDGHWIADYRRIRVKALRIME